ncbi:hypothetical protein LXA43DRAFT_1099493 [Ganoderma leucocontextum]|nr:hypothetical protein LXA43DRAFT_1099493 [Ganoderma leucocontextum]
MPLARFVFWFKDACVPAWHMVPFEPGRPVDLWRLRWLRTTAPDPPGFEVLLYEIFDVNSSEWDLKTVTERLLVDSEAPVVLIRAYCVEDCPMLGFELAGIYRALGYPSLPPHIFEPDSEFFRVISEQTPVIHWIPFFNGQCVVKLSTLFTLSLATLEGHENVHIWLSDWAEWEPIPMRSRIKVPQNFDTLLVKLPEVGVTAGAGDALVHLERGFARRPELSQSQAAVKWRDHIAIARSVSPVYDVAVALAMLNRETGSLLRQLGAIEYGGSLYSTPGDVVMVAKDVADGVDLGHAVKRTRLS